MGPKQPRQQARQPEPLTPAESAKLGEQIRELGIEEVARRAGMSAPTILRGAAGLPIHQANRTVTRAYLATLGSST